MAQEATTAGLGEGGEAGGAAGGNTRGSLGMSVRGLELPVQEEKEEKAVAQRGKRSSPVTPASGGRMSPAKRPVAKEPHALPARLQEWASG